MAATTKKELVGFVQRRIPPQLGDPRQIARPDNVESWIEAACFELANEFFENKAEPSRSRLQKPYTLTLTTGVASLTTSTDMLIESLREARLLHSSSTVPMEYVPDVRDLSYMHATDLLYYAIANDAVYTRAGDGTLTGLTGSLDVIGAFFVPVIHLDTPASTTLPAILRPRLINKLLQIAAQALSLPVGALGGVEAAEPKR